MESKGAASFGGDLGLRVIRPGQERDLGLVPDELGSPGIRAATVHEVMRLGLPQQGLSHEVNRYRSRNFRHIQRGIRDVFWANRGRAPALLGFLSLAKILRDGTRIDYGLVSAQVVTDVWVNLLVDELSVGAVDLTAHNFHGIGLGVTAEAAGDTDLVTELTTQYIVNSTRATGTQLEGASANIYRTVATNEVDAGVALREHGIFDNATVGSGILMDRSLFAEINLVSGESLQSTYELTATAGG